VADKIAAFCRPSVRAPVCELTSRNTAKTARDRPMVTMGSW